MNFRLTLKCILGRKPGLILENWSGKELSSVLLNKLTIQMSTAFTLLLFGKFIIANQRKGVRHAGAVQQNQIGKCPVTCRKEFKTEESGKYEVFRTGDLVLVNWNDSKLEFVLSNFESIRPLRSVKRKSKKPKKITDINMLLMNRHSIHLWEESAH